MIDMIIDKQIQVGNYYYRRIITPYLPYPWMSPGWTMVPSGAYEKLTKGSKHQSSPPDKGAKIDTFPQGVSQQGHVYMLRERSSHLISSKSMLDGFGPPSYTLIVANMQGRLIVLQLLAMSTPILSTLVPTSLRKSLIKMLTKALQRSEVLNTYKYGSVK